MNRQVVKEVPKQAHLIRPPEVRPTISKMVEETVRKVVETSKGKEVRETSEVRRVEIPWLLDSDIARLLGEAKSLPKGLILCLSSNPYIKLCAVRIAWFASRLGLDIFNFRDSYYLTKVGRDDAVKV